MLRHPIPAPDPSEPTPPTTDEHRTATDDASFDGDFADLVGRFAGQSGGNLSPELSADLALQIVLNEIAEQACVATGATGAAIVLHRDGEMICRARSGVTAPELGTRFDGASGLSGECVKTGQTQRCDDVLADPRADTEASQRLSVRSVMVMPLLRGSELVGLFELFSSQPHAFGERDERTLEALGERILSTQERAVQWSEQSEVENEISAAAEPQGEILRDGPPETAGDSVPERTENFSRRGFNYVTWTLGAGVLAFTILLGVQGSRLLASRTVKVRRQPTAAAPAAKSASNAVEPDAGAARKGETGNGAAPQSTTKPSVNAQLPAGGLLIFQNGKEVFRLPPEKHQIAQNQSLQKQGESASTGQESGVQRAPSIEPESMIELSPADTQSVLLHRVEPQYPEQARQQKIQGPVVLEVHIGADGAVQNVELVSGPPELVQAAIDAVRQWRFKPRTADGRPVEMQSRVTLNFKLQE